MQQKAQRPLFTTNLCHAPGPVRNTSRNISGRSHPSIVGKPRHSHVLVGKCQGFTVRTGGAEISLGASEPGVSQASQVDDWGRGGLADYVAEAQLLE